MIIQPNEARELCSNSEWELVESSFSPVVETLRLSDLKSKLERVTKLRRKTTDLVVRQHSDSRKRTFESAPTGSLRAAKPTFCPHWLCGANSRGRSPGQGASRVMSDLLPAGRKQDATRRIAKNQ